MRQTFILSIVICLLFCRQAFSQKVFKGEIPPEFNCTGCMLVVLQADDKMTRGDKKQIEKINELFEDKFIKNYEGKNVFISAKDLDTSTLYTDSSVYRFILRSEVYSLSGSMPSSTGRNGTFNYTSYALSLWFYDRLKKKNYLQLSNWPSWAKNMEKVSEALNKLLKK
jgi:hypothetical protein